MGSRSDKNHSFIQKTFTRLHLVLPSGDRKIKRLLKYKRTFNSPVSEETGKFTTKWYIYNTWCRNRQKNKRNEIGFSELERQCLAHDNLQ